MDKTLRRKLLRYSKITGFSFLACITIFTGILIGRKILASVYRTDKSYETRIIPGAMPTPDSRNLFEKIVDSVIEPNNELKSTSLDTNKALVVGADEIKRQPSNSNSSSSCIVTIFGSQYNVTSLKSTHSGGDVFNCGTDMSSQYETQHGTNLNRMKSYLITSGPRVNNSPQTPNPPVTQSNACIITIGGEYFDVTSLRYSHSGGDVFSCGSDMTSMYTVQHGTNMSRMNAYRLASANSTALPTNTPRAGNTSTPIPTPMPTLNGGSLEIDETDDGNQTPNF